VDTRDTPEQSELRRSARQLARELGPAAVGDLDDATRAKRLRVAVRDAGWLELRHDDGAGAPLASGVEAAIVADALGGAAADAPFAGPVLAADLARRAGADPLDGAVVAFSASLADAVITPGPVTSVPLTLVDAGDDDRGYVLVGDGADHRLALITHDGAPTTAGGGSDLTRAVRTVPVGVPVEPIPDLRALTADDVAAWSALGLALTCADLVGVMRGVLDLTVAYAVERRQYDVPVGSFQAVQHLLAEARCLMEGSLSTALHASWAVDALAPDDARRAGRVAKAYCARAARTVCETAIQVHGGIGNTWECMAHVYLRRALLASQWFGDDRVQLRALQEELLDHPVGRA
jgi:alkylation response protein AidB-like acyl-CoA dehydrogenase